MGPHPRRGQPPQEAGGRSLARRAAAGAEAKALCEAWWAAGHRLVVLGLDELEPPRAASRPSQFIARLNLVDDERNERRARMVIPFASTKVY